MQSIRSKLVLWLIKHRHFFKFKLSADVVDEHFSVEQFRQDIDRLSAKMRTPKGVIIEKIAIGKIQAEWIRPVDTCTDKVLMYIHGGGFISGSCLTHRMHVAKFANESRLPALVFDYRLAPEHPFPAALEDCEAVYTWLLQQGFTAQNIVVGGESAGATLTLSLLLALKEKQLALPRAAFSISPVTDLRCLADSFTYNASKDIAPIGSWNLWTQYYIADHDPTDPMLSPQFGDFHGLPPVYICVGSHEIHLDDCLNFAAKAKEQGVKVTLKVWPKMVHAFPLLSPLFPEAKQALADICRFIQTPC
ncbi:alpha/beta hydrolase [Teredinibacter sp. KSP-S5-2]|uniref:alpha/beta hydrolase n=1 Tax=Teredinibacter sp. KSP-S5-2 TaxID=3034506 RepID=UPI0029346387|nr:alpha/beta hydrolase [Teredinibacter sp. KSP-S5-2]WNO10768.1 alpha/beta hydrolase [Teredinibacter sp. KSP-S5-2]